MSRIRNKMILMLMAAMFALPTMAHWRTGEQLSDISTLNTGFQSTSTMSGSGSTYSAAPQWNADGTATFNNAASAPAQAPSGPRRVNPPIPGGNPTPIGDGVWVLLVMAACYVLVMRRKIGRA